MATACSAMTERARSPIDTIPAIRPLSTTGRWRMCFRVMIDMASDTVVSEVTVVIGLVMMALTLVCSGSRFDRATDLP